jgi:tol-pal system protein YbgF
MTVSSHPWRRAALFAAPLLLLVAGAGAQEQRPSGNLFDNLFNRGEPQNRAEPQGGQIAQGGGSDLAVRLDRLENQLRQMTGAIEQLQFRNQQLEQALKRLQDDNEFRFQQLGARGAPSATTPPPTVRNAPQALPGPAAPVAPVVPGRRSDVFDPAQAPSAPGAPHALGGGPVATVPAVPGEPEVAIGAPGGRRAAGTPLDLSTLTGNAASEPPVAGAAPNSTPPRNVGGPQLATLPPSQSPKDEYDLAYGYVLRKDYALAEQAFRDYVKKNPGDPLIPDANYWLGETMFQRQRYQDAADAFLVVVRNYEKAGKAPDALLRLGQSLAALGQKEMACASLGEVERKYPRASASVKRGVAQEQKRASC